MPNRSKFIYKKGRSLAYQGSKHLSHEDRKVAEVIPKKSKRKGIIKIVSEIDEI